MNEDIEYKEAEQRKRTFNGMSAKEWTVNSRSVWNDVSSPRSKNKILHGATFPEKLSDRLISMYSKVGDTVLDPFLGSGTTVVSAIKGGRRGVGIELTEKYFDLAEREIQSVVESISEPDYQLFLGDCESKLKDIKDGEIQLTITSPPYANLIHIALKDRNKRGGKSYFETKNNSQVKIYSELDEDLGNMTMDEYKEKVSNIMKLLYDKTKVGGYNIWVVKDFRDTKNGIPYVNLHQAIIECGVAGGFIHHDLIIWDQNENRSLVLLGYPSIFYVNQNNSYIVVFRKV